MIEEATDDDDYDHDDDYDADEDGDVDDDSDGDVDDEQPAATLTAAAVTSQSVSTEPTLIYRYLRLHLPTLLLTYLLLIHSPSCHMLFGAPSKAHQMS